MRNLGYKLDTWKIQNFINSIERSPRTIHGVYESLNMALRWAVKMKLINYNPAEEVELPHLGKTQIEYWNTEQVKKFLQSARSSRFWMLFELALATGMRQGELLGLRWNDIDFKKQKLSIRHTLHWLKGGTFELAPPKTQNSLRVIPLSPKLLSLLKKHKVQQDQERLAAGPAWNDHGFVFTNKLGNTLEHNNVYKRDFKPLVEKAGVPKIRFHGLRHTYATLCLERGMHVKVLSSRLGHSREGFTLQVYAGMTPVLEEGTATILDDVIGN